MNGNDRIQLRHMSNAAREAISFAEGRTRNDLEHDRQLVLALVKAIEIVGEAASRTTLATQNELPEVPWRSIVGMRNRLVHVYYDIDLDILWQTVQEALPDLLAQLEPGAPASRR